MKTTHLVPFVHFLEVLTIPFELPPIQIRLSYLENELTAEALTTLIFLLEDLFNDFEFESMVVDRDFQLMDDLEYRNLTIKVQNFRATQARVKLFGWNHAINDVPYSAFFISLYNEATFSYSAPIRKGVGADSKVYEFPSLPTLKAIENEMESMLQNRTQLEHLRSNLVSIYADEARHLETIEFEGYMKTSINSFSEMSNSQSVRPSKFTTSRNILFIFVGIFAVGFAIFFKKFQHKRRGYVKQELEM